MLLPCNHWSGRPYIGFPFACSPDPGQEEAITALAAICARHAAGKVRSPGGLLRRMVELHQQGELRLDRTLFGLADKVRKETGAAGVNRPGRA